jgi:hypothetical protein
VLLYHLDMLKVARAASSIRIPVCDRAEGLFCDSMHPEGRKECEAALKEPLARAKRRNLESYLPLTQPKERLERLISLGALNRVPFFEGCSWRAV